MVRDESVTRLIQLVRSDDAAERDVAARFIWHRYFRDLLKLARNKLNGRLRRREDEEDVVQSARRPDCTERSIERIRGKSMSHDDALSRAQGRTAWPR